MDAKSQPPTFVEPDIPRQSPLAAAERRIARGCRSMSANLMAWAEVLDALGWCVALRLSGRTPFLSPRAQRWFAEKNVDGLHWKNLADEWRADDLAEVLAQADDVRVWRTPEPEESSKTDQSLLALLTRREIEILSWIQRGKTSPEIAIILGCALRTVENHIARLYSKLGVRSRAQVLPRTDVDL